MDFGMKRRYSNICIAVEAQTRNFLLLTLFEFLVLLEEFLHAQHLKDCRLKDLRHRRKIALVTKAGDRVTISLFNDIDFKIYV